MSPTEYQDTLPMGLPAARAPQADDGLADDDCDLRHYHPRPRRPGRALRELTARQWLGAVGRGLFAMLCLLAVLLLFHGAHI